ncbi:dihydropteroate synthase [Russula earlei]|uniref:Dihydropteroate synthase n=1 Tax=Russula earlei TaxID=71964 RepID=A0ACC0TX96_9AGAM|nr:dihydropteroate synthase [Russula earlei]
MFTLNCRGRLLTIEQPIVMGIINTTPDSFYEGSRKQDAESALYRAEQLLREGATMLDIGGQTTKPGSTPVPVEDELTRVLPVIEAIHRRFPDAYLSVDTYYARVANEAVAAGACIVNDVSGGMADEAMLATVASLQVPYVCMHMKGKQQTMQQHPVYENVTREVLDFFIHRIEDCRLAGIHDVIADVGLGFGKTFAHNFQLLRELPMFRVLHKPMLVGVSRKSTIYKTLGITAEEALNGTTVLNTISLLNGAAILRVHDVKEAMEAITLVKACQ